MPCESGLMPYSTPPEAGGSPGKGAGRSAEARGNAAARAWVSMVRRSCRLSVARGRVVVQPDRPGQQRCEPGRADLGRVSGDDQGGDVAVADPQKAGGDFDRGGGDGGRQRGTPAASIGSWVVGGGAVSGECLHDVGFLGV